ncbi:MAG: EAL domain-containing protein [Bacillota bacterium]
MKPAMMHWRKNNLIKVAFFNIIIMFGFFVLFSYAAAFTIERFTVDYYDEMMYSANQRFSQQFDRVLTELDELTFHAGSQVKLQSNNQPIKRQALKELINYSPMIDYGFIVDQDKVVQASVLYGTASASDYQLESITFVDEPSLQKAQTIRKENLLELLIPLKDEQLHLFIDLSANNTLQNFFHSLSFSESFYIGIFDEADDLIYNYDLLADDDEANMYKFYQDRDSYSLLSSSDDAVNVLHHEDSHFMIATQQLSREGWTLALFVPEVLAEQFMASIFDTLVPILIVLAILYLMIMLYAYYRSQKPYQALIEAIDELSEGDYTHRIRYINHNTRIGAINHKFNQMAHELEKSRLTLHKNEQLLASQKDFLDRIINVSPMMIYTMNADGIYTLVNNQYAELFGFTAKSMLGRHALNATNDVPATHYHLKLHQSILLSQEPTTYEDKQTLPDGTIRWYRVTKQPIESIEGKGKEILMVATDITEIKENQALIEHQANHDELTGIGNRKYFKTIVDEAIEQTDQDNEGFAVMFLDLDRFKYVNDTFGHDAGDKLLIDVANRIKAVIKDRDYVFRFGGDEFTVLTYFTENRQEVTELAKKIIHTLTKPYTFNDHSFIVTASIGISLYPKHSQSLNELTKYADLSMYQAKQQGKNTFRFYTPALETEVSHHIQLETDLFQALERNELYVVYQPIVDTQTKEIHAVEALLRWQHNKLGAIAPNVFIPIAEANGFMHQFSQFLLKEATETISSYNKRHQRSIKLHINLTEKECRDVKTIESIYKQFEESNVRLDQLVIEINENLTRDKCKNLKDKLKIYQQADVQVAIDSFGDHYLSLRQLKTLPFKIIKLSQGTLHDALSDEEGLSSYMRLVKLAKDLNLIIIQEGVETAEEVALIESIQLDAYQGFLMSQPLTKEEFEQDY